MPCRYVETDSRTLDTATGSMAHSASMRAASTPLNRNGIRTTKPQVGDPLGPPTSGADDGIRTRDPHLGKVMLYQLSHVRSDAHDRKARAAGPPPVRPPTRGRYCDEVTRFFGALAADARSAAFLSSSSASPR